MPDRKPPLKMPPPALAPGQVGVNLGAKRYVLNVPHDAEIDQAEELLFRGMRFHRDAFVLLWPPIGSEPEEPKP